MQLCDCGLSQMSINQRCYNITLNELWNSDLKVELIQTQQNELRTIHSYNLHDSDLLASPVFSTSLVLGYGMLLSTEEDWGV